MSWEVCYKYRQNLLTTCRLLSRTYLWISADLLTETSLTLTAAMRPRFSIEWMAQSSQPVEPETSTASGPVAWGTYSESTEPGTCLTNGPAAWGTRSETLPGFYCTQKSEDLDTFRSNNLPQTSACVQVTQSGFSSGTEEETSGYESEGGQVLSPTTSSPSPPAGRRPRTAFTAEQIQNLERAFKKNAYLGTQDKMELCKKLNLSDKQIRNWFQNRRMKHKRQTTHHRDGSAGSPSSSGFEPLEGADASSPYSSQPLEASGSGESTEGDQGGGSVSSSGDNALPTLEDTDRASLSEPPLMPGTSGSPDSPPTFSNSTERSEAGPAAAPVAPSEPHGTSASSTALPDLTLFGEDACLSPSLQSSLDSPVDFSEEDFDLFTSTLCTIDLQHLNF
ncbi:ventrally expressed dharma/bozozok antagonist [Austrofundulus limnaeus]|uniref:Ventrally expressed dharma/bozozok antagonist n=1 Tax=Austrofundulus limnaeus TaxID=52670 RepID=A0A2I4C8X6_AUSLI|nr:PREDICTED: homeobox protein Hox-B2a-like [Austrofundulus limnaeus]